MSLGYAEKLSWRDDLGGQLGAPELQDTDAAVESKLTELADLVRRSTRIVVFTGAGISTSCGIPDFRGPKGVWTLQRAGEPIPRPKVTFAAAKPSLTHQALVGLLQTGKLVYVVSQNVDGLHLRSGIPRQQLAELHGNCFAERCRRCGHEYIRDFEIETVGFKPTGRRCSQGSCRGALKDHILDWEDALPEDELHKSEKESSAADLAICLGTSLQITPACNLPLRTVKAGGKLVIVNLQATPKDKRASLVVRARADSVMAALMGNLGYQIPTYRREDHVAITCSLSAAKRKGDTADRVVTISISGRGVDATCPLPLVESVAVAFLDPGALGTEELVEQPFTLTRGISAAESLRIRLELRLSEAADADKRTVVFEEAFQLPAPGRRGMEGLQQPPICKTRSFLTQEVAFGDQVTAAHAEGPKKQKLTHVEVKQ